MYISDEDRILQIYERAVEMLNEMGYESSVYEKYSGRGMYGRTTTGIVTDASGPEVGAALVWAYNELKTDDDCTALEYDNQTQRGLIPTHWDSMGLSTIYY